MIYQKHTPSHTLTNITQARLIKRSQSSNSLQFQPIKLKTLQEARNAAKSSTTRKFSLTPSDFEKTLFSLLPIEKNSLEQITEVKNKGTESEEPDQNESRAERRKTQILGQKEKKERVVTARQSVKESPKRQLSGNFERRSGVRRSTSKMKVANSIASVLDIIEDDKNARKKLTKDQEKGLISRLQGRSLFKFN